jgi:hypothetical protein
MKTDPETCRLAAFVVQACFVVVTFRSKETYVGFQLTYGRVHLRSSPTTSKTQVPLNTLPFCSLTRLPSFAIEHPTVNDVLVVSLYTSLKLTYSAG